MLFKLKEFWVEISSGTTWKTKSREILWDLIGDDIGDDIRDDGEDISR